ncbi:ead/Ea22-like family protein, partial [Kluyvera sp. STS39-E]|uniref:ead/Ea22-like family protein n=1 Tax=Kluyvera sp. STS39-E TaxID=3234748 RepID=UPI0034C6D6BB
MNDITALTPEKLVEIRQRHTPIAAPKCHICGAEMTIGAMSASRIVYACSGATYDDAGCHYAPGRSIADDHYAQSRVTVVDVSDPDVLELVEALEKAQRANAAQDDHINQQQDRIDTLERRNAELGKYAGELESRTVTVKLPPTFWYEHDDLAREVPVLDKRLVKKAL